MARLEGGDDRMKELMDRIEPWFIGLWRYRVRGRKPAFAVTYCIDGYYYDTQGHPTPEGALTAALRVISRLTGAKGKKDRPSTKAGARRTHSSSGKNRAR